MEDWERLAICCVSTSKRRNPVNFQSKKGFMGAFFLLEISPWPMALMVSQSERQGWFATGGIEGVEAVNAGGGWAEGISVSNQGGSTPSSTVPTDFGDQHMGSRGHATGSRAFWHLCCWFLRVFPGQQ